MAVPENDVVASTTSTTSSIAPTVTAAPVAPPAAAPGAKLVRARSRDNYNSKLNAIMAREASIGASALAKENAAASALSSASSSAAPSPATPMPSGSGLHAPPTDMSRLSAASTVSNISGSSVVEHGSSFSNNEAPFMNAPPSRAAGVVGNLGSGTETSASILHVPTGRETASDSVYEADANPLNDGQNTAKLTKRAN